MKRVVIESPYGNIYKDIIKENLIYARACMRDSIKRGEAPLASHLLYTQPEILDDDIPEERSLGIECGLAWGALAELIVVYTDRGITKGMKLGIERAEELNIPIEYRSLPYGA